MTSFGSHRRNTDRSLKVSTSSYRHCSDLVRCGNSSGETIVVEEEQSLVVGLWGRPRGVHCLHCIASSLAVDGLLQLHSDDDAVGWLRDVAMKALVK